MDHQAEKILFNKMNSISVNHNNLKILNNYLKKFQIYKLIM